MSYKELEHIEQTKLIEFWASICANYNANEFNLYAIPNGGLRHIAVAKKMKLEGVRSGIPDLFLSIPTKAFNGLYIEMKKPKGGVVSDNQKKVIYDFCKRGYCCAVCRGFECAKEVIINYLEGVYD